MVRWCVRVYCEAMSRYETAVLTANAAAVVLLVMSVLFFVFYGIYAEKVLLVVAVGDLLLGTVGWLLLVYLMALVARYMQECEDA